MAIQTRFKGTTEAVKNVGAQSLQANAAIINTGLNSPVAAYKIGTLGATSNLAAELGRGTNGTTGAVEAILNTISANATVVAYQVDAAAQSQLSVIVERSSWVDDTSLQNAIRALGSNIGAFSTVTASTAVVTSTGGIKLA
jgi:hypothetical protein